MDSQQIPLRDLHLPEMIGWWPLAPGWWLLIGLALFGLFLMLRHNWRRWRHNAPRRLALRELKRVRSEYDRGVDTVNLAVQLSELLRRAMLAYAPRSEVAGLTGANWLAWLDRGLEEQPFSKGPGQILLSLPYQQPDQGEPELDIDELTEVVSKRLHTPLPEAAP